MNYQKLNFYKKFSRMLEIHMDLLLNYSSKIQKNYDNFLIENIHLN